MPKLPIPFRSIAFLSSRHLARYLYFLLGIIALSNNQTDIYNKRKDIRYDSITTRFSVKFISRWKFSREEVFRCFFFFGRIENSPTKPERGRETFQKMSSHQWAMEKKQKKIHQTHKTDTVSTNVIYPTLSAAQQWQHERTSELMPLKAEREKVENVSDEICEKEFFINATGGKITIQPQECFIRRARSNYANSPSARIQLQGANCIPSKLWSVRTREKAESQEKYSWKTARKPRKSATKRKGRKNQGWIVKWIRVSLVRFFH